MHVQHTKLAGSVAKRSRRVGFKRELRAKSCTVTGARLYAAAHILNHRGPLLATGLRDAGAAAARTLQGEAGGVEGASPIYRGCLLQHMLTF
eukprot:9489038-Pyramimonas_sp.AAC.3